MINEYRIRFVPLVERQYRMWFEVKPADDKHFACGFYFCYMRKLDKQIWEECLGNSEKTKAIAMFLYVKEHKGASVFPNFSILQLAKFVGLSRNTTRKRLHTLEKMGLVERVGWGERHLKFKKARARYNNVDISKIDKGSVKSIEFGLKALLICVVQGHKEYIKQRFLQATQPSKDISLKDVKRARKYIHRRGISDFVDNGISYRYLANKLKVSYRVVSKVIRYGIACGMFVKNCHIQYVDTVKGCASEYVEYSDKPNLFCTKKNNNVYSYACNTFTLC